MHDKWGHTVYDFGNGSYPGLVRPYMSIANPMALYELDTNNHVADIVSARAYSDFNIIEGLKLTLNLGYDVDNTYSTSIRNPFYGQFAKGGGNVYKAFIRDYSINTQQLVTYLKSFGHHNFDFLLGHEFYKNTAENMFGSKSNMYNPDNKELNGAILDPRTGSNKSYYMTEGYLGRVQYDYNNKYFGQFSFRRDASSRFDEDNRWGNFWSVGASWIISREDFMASVRNTVDMLKLKFSYGMQGNDAVGSFRYTDIYSLSNSNDQLAVQFYSKGNKKLTWETSKNLNVGVEFGLWNNRLAGEFDVYMREVTDMLFFRKVPNSNGYGGYFDNIGAMKNTGFDFSLTGVLIDSKDLKWTLSVNGGYFKNKLTKLPEEWEAVEGGYREGASVYRVGGSIYDRAYPKYLGVNDKGLPMWQTYNPKTKEYGSTTEYTKALASENRKIFTNIAPKLNGGINTNLEYKGIDFGMTLSYALGGKMYDSTYAVLMHGGSEAGNAWHKDILKSWTPEKNSDVPMVNYGGKWANAGSDRFLVSRNYLALNNITLGYTLPKELVTKANISSVRVYVMGDNLGVLSARKGFDPRFGGGIGYKAMRTFSGGIRVTL